jgi:hypothetical protein
MGNSDEELFENTNNSNEKNWDIKFLNFKKNKKKFYIIQYDKKNEILFPLVTLNTLLKEHTKYVYL